MIRSQTFTWALLGALVTSVALNVHLSSASSAPVQEPGATDAGCAVNCLPELELTSEQRAAIEACCSDCCSDRDRMSAELRDLCRELADLFAPGASPDVQEADALVTRITAKLGDVLRRRLDAMIRVRETLTPDQIARLERAR